MGEDEKALIGWRDVYETLWRCRDFEIDHVWQRAVFLTAFQIGCFAVYGGLILGTITAEHMRLPFACTNLLAFLISVVGLILSFLWIMMAKGSKAWYEHYEQAITMFETRIDDAFAVDPKLRLTQIHTHEAFSPPRTSSFLWNTLGGSYSVAKINIVIGHLSSIVWAAIALLHIVMAALGKATVVRMVTTLSGPVLSLLMFLLLAIVLLAFYSYVRRNVKSTFLKDNV